MESPRLWKWQCRRGDTSEITDKGFIQAKNQQDVLQYLKYELKIPTNATPCITLTPCPDYIQLTPEMMKHKRKEYDYFIRQQSDAHNQLTMDEEILMKDDETVAELYSALLAKIHGILQLLHDEDYDARQLQYFESNDVCFVQVVKIRSITPMNNSREYKYGNEYENANVDEYKYGNEFENANVDIYVDAKGTRLRNISLVSLKEFGFRVGQVVLFFQQDVFINRLIGSFCGQLSSESFRRFRRVKLHDGGRLKFSCLLPMDIYWRNYSGFCPPKQVKQRFNPQINSCEQFYAILLDELMAFIPVTPLITSIIAPYLTIIPQIGDDLTKHMRVGFIRDKVPLTPLKDWSRRTHTEDLKYIGVFPGSSTKLLSNEIDQLKELQKERESIAASLWQTRNALKNANKYIINNTEK